MKIVIAGGTGFVGKALVRELKKNSHQVVVLTRSFIEDDDTQVRYIQWMTPGANPSNTLLDADVFINLGGESINGGRWSNTRKEKIVNSRIDVVKSLFEIINNMKNKPKVFINASAIGIYGTSNDEVFTEEDSGTDSDFLAKTVQLWEKEASKISTLGVRTVYCRFGIILDKNEGALPKIAVPYKLFIGGNIGNGRQWMSWIHIEDVVRAILFVTVNEQMEGPVNFTAPNPVMMREFGKTMAATLHRPHWLSVPSFSLRLLLGEMSTLVVEGQKVLPKRLLDNNFEYKYPDLNSALKNIFAEKVSFLS